MSEYPPVSYFNRLKRLRMENNLTLKQLGDALNMRDNTLSQYETGKRSPNNETWENIANYFGVSVKYLRGFSTERVDNFEVSERLIKNLKFSDIPSENTNIQYSLIDILATLFDEIDELKRRVSELERPEDFVDHN